MSDAVDILLRDKPNLYAKKLLSFHHENPEFLPRIVAELRLLKRQGRKSAGARSVIHFLRWEWHWKAIDEFGVNDHLTALAFRVCALLWPDINGMVRLHHSVADDILGTRIVRRSKRYGSFLYPGKSTLNKASFLPSEKNCTGLVRPIQQDASPGAPVFPPEVQEVDRPPTFYDLIAESDAESIAAPLRDIVDESPNPLHPTLLAWLLHAGAQPEIYAFLERKLQQRQPRCFSANSLIEYARWSIQRAAESQKRFTLQNRFGALYSRTLIRLNPQFNGLSEFRADSKGPSRAGNSNRLLGCYLASEPVNGEPYRRLKWNVVAR